MNYRQRLLYHKVIANLVCGIVLRNFAQASSIFRSGTSAESRAVLQSIAFVMPKRHLTTDMPDVTLKRARAKKLFSPEIKDNSPSEWPDVAADVGPHEAAKCERITKVLDTLYPEPPCPLNHRDAFTLLCAVVLRHDPHAHLPQLYPMTSLSNTTIISRSLPSLSAQTTDGKVNDVTKELFTIAPSPRQLAALEPEQVPSVSLSHPLSL